MVYPGVLVRAGFLSVTGQVLYIVCLGNKFIRILVHLNSLINLKRVSNRRIILVSIALLSGFKFGLGLRRSKNRLCNWAYIIADEYLIVAPTSTSAESRRRQDFTVAGWSSRRRKLTRLNT